jgi:anti-anti-sigma factor
VADTHVETGEEGFGLRRVDACTLAVRGDVDDVTADELRAALDADWVRHLDMSAVTFFNSCGVRALLDARRARGEAPLHVVAPSRAVRRVLELLGLTAIVVDDGDGPAPAP